MSYDIQKVKSAFEGNPELFIQTYFPHAKRQGRNYVVGDVNGSPGKSMTINTDNRSGKFKDFASDDSGDFIDLLMANKGIQFKDALEEIAELYKVRKEEDMTRGKRPIKPIAPMMKVNPVEQTSDIEKYLTEVRGIRRETIEKYRIHGTDDGFIAYPVIGRNQRVLQHSYISLEQDEKGKKIVKQDKGAYSFCFGMHLLKPDARRIVITEGQIDCMTLNQAGIDNVISIPMGIKNMEYIDTHWDIFMQCEDIILCFDMDDIGQETAKKTVKRLGLDRCRIAEMPYKDANECWNNGCDESDLIKIIANAKYLQNEKIKEIGGDPEETEQRLIEKELNQGDPFFLEPLELNQRLGELTVWTGYSGCGKTTLLNQHILNLIAKSDKYKVCYASFEQDPLDIELMFARQITGMGFKSKIRHVLAFLNQKVYQYIPPDILSPSDMLESFNYCIRRYGCNIFIVDNLVTCGIPEGENEEQRKFANDLKHFCKANNVSVHLVAHSRKSKDDDNEMKIPGKHSVRGSSSITDICMNGLTIWRNPTLVHEREVVTCDGIIKVWKQRETGVHNTVKYYYNGAYKCATIREDKHYEPPIKI